MIAVVATREAKSAFHYHVVVESVWLSDPCGERNCPPIELHPAPHVMSSVVGRRVHGEHVSSRSNQPHTQHSRSEVIYPDFAGLEGSNPRERE